MSDQTIGFLIVLGFLAIVWWWEVLRVVLPRALASVRRIPRSLSTRRRDRKAKEVAAAQASCPHMRLHRKVELTHFDRLCSFEEADFLMEFTCEDCGACLGRVRGPVRLEYAHPERNDIFNPEGTS